MSSCCPYSQSGVLMVARDAKSLSRLGRLNGEMLNAREAHLRVSMLARQKSLARAVGIRRRPCR